MADRKERLKQNYQRLRAAGFSPKEAARLRGASEDKIARAIQQQKLPAPAKKQQAAGRKAGRLRRARAYGWLTNRDGYPILKGNPKSANFPYQRVHDRLGIVYYRKYSYVIGFEVKHVDGTREVRYVTIVSGERRTQKELFAEVWNDIVKMNDSRYEGRALKTSLHIVSAFYNPEGW